jgi:hypothetical protein
VATLSAALTTKMTSELFILNEGLTLIKKQSSNHEKRVVKGERGFGWAPPT